MSQTPGLEEATPACANEGTPAQASPATAKSPLVRALLLVMAVICLGMAALGAITPGLPSTVFVLLAAWAAARSSPRFHAWLLRHRLFGPMLHNWHNGRCVSRQAKWGATWSMLACSVLLVATVPNLWLVVAAMACMASVQLWLWHRPEPA